MLYFGTCYNDILSLKRRIIKLTLLVKLFILKYYK